MVPCICVFPTLAAGRSDPPEKPRTDQMILRAVAVRGGGDHFCTNRGWLEKGHRLGRTDFRAFAITDPR